MKGNAPKKKSIQSNSISRCQFLWLTILNLAIFCGALYTYISAQKKVADALSSAEKAKSVLAFSKANHSSKYYGDAHLPPSLPSSPKTNRSVDDIACSDPTWCSIPMPSKSYFKFRPPIDEYRWRVAQAQAANGDQILLDRISRVFPNPFDFLDGDKSFRRQHERIDIFVDTKTDFESLLPGGLEDYKRRLESLDNHNIRVQKSPSNETPDGLQIRIEIEGKNRTEWYEGSRSQNTEEDEAKDGEEVKSNLRMTGIFGEYSQSLERSLSLLKKRGGNREREEDDGAVTIKEQIRESRLLRQKKVLEGAPRSGESHVDKRSIVPAPYDFRSAKRAPILQIGYIGFQKDSSNYFSGNYVGGVFMKRVNFLLEWSLIKKEINTPFITMCVLNENWGWLSTMFPNRTAAWGKCCDKDDKLHKNLHDFLNHDKTLMLVIGQHSNISHPKILTVPRGIPLTWTHTSQMMWDAIRNTLKTVKRSRLLFASTSSWGKRPQMLQCISQKMTAEEFEGHIATPQQDLQAVRADRTKYYQKLGGTRFGVCLPGLGYDTFRMWELLTMGAVVIIEKAVGFDRTLWRLPALLVDDFDDITPDLLRSVYVEALYRADEFEFERLTQSFWNSVIANVSATMSTQTLLDKFPMEAEEDSFSRPRVPYPCGVTNTCGPGTNRTPKRSC